MVDSMDSIPSTNEVVESGIWLERRTPADKALDIAAQFFLPRALADGLPQSDESHKTAALFSSIVEQGAKVSEFLSAGLLAQSGDPSLMAYGLLRLFDAPGYAEATGEKWKHVLFSLQSKAE